MALLNYPNLNYKHYPIHRINRPFHQYKRCTYLLMHIQVVKRLLPIVENLMEVELLKDSKGTRVACRSSSRRRPLMVTDESNKAF